MRRVLVFLLTLALLAWACGPALAASGEWVRVDVVEGGKNAPPGQEPPKVEKLPGGKEAFSSPSWLERVKAALEKVADSVMKAVTEPFRKEEVRGGQEVIVSLTDASVLDRVLKAVPGAKVKQHLPGSAALLELPGDPSLDATLQRLKSVDGVRHAQPNFVYGARPVKLGIPPGNNVVRIQPYRPPGNNVARILPFKPSGFVDRVKAGFDRVARAVGGVVR